MAQLFHFFCSDHFFTYRASKGPQATLSASGSRICRTCILSMGQLIDEFSFCLVGAIRRSTSKSSFAVLLAGRLFRYLSFIPNMYMFNNNRCIRIIRIIRISAWLILRSQRAGREGAYHDHRHKQRQQSAFDRFHNNPSFLTFTERDAAHEANGLSVWEPVCNGILTQHCKMFVSNLYPFCIIP